MRLIKIQPAFILAGLLLVLSTTLFADTDPDYYDKHFYSKIPWAVSHRKKFKVLLKHQVVTPYTTLDRDKTALLVIDTQNDWGTPEGSAPETDIDIVVPNINKAIDIWRESGSLIIHVVRLYYADGSNADMSRKWQMQQGKLRMAVPGSWGSQLVDDSAPAGTILDYKLLLNLGVQKIGPNEYVIYKPHYNGFDRSSINDFLQSEGINSVVFVGMTFPNCIRGTQYGATDLHYRVGAVPEAMTQVYLGGLVAMLRQGVQLMSMEGFEKFAKGLD